VGPVAVHWILALQFSGKIGIGTVITFGLAVAAVAVFLTKLLNGDAPELRQGLADEITRREAAEADAKHLEIELAATKARTDISGLESRMAARFEAWEKHQEQTNQILAGLVEAVQALSAASSTT
jgi:hypothetical protein